MNHTTKREVLTDRRYRIIHSLQVEFGLTTLVIPIDSEGKSTAPKQLYTFDKEREIDLRIGDELTFESGVKKITRITAYRGVMNCQMRSKAISSTNESVIPDSALQMPSEQVG